MWKMAKYKFVYIHVLKKCGRSWVRESRSGQTKDYQLTFVAYITKHADIRRKSKDWLARNQDNVSEWSNMYIRGLLFQ
jgi:hypothetical protein